MSFDKGEARQCLQEGLCPIAIDVRFLLPKRAIDTRSLVVAPRNAPNAESAGAKQGYRNRAKQKHAL